MYPTFEQFVFAWETSSTPVQVCCRLQRRGFAGMTLTETLFWARHLRKCGVRLRPMKGEDHRIAHHRFISAAR